MAYCNNEHSGSGHSAKRFDQPFDNSDSANAAKACSARVSDTGALTPKVLATEAGQHHISRRCDAWYR